TSDLVISASTVNPLSGTKSLLITKDAANRQGQGVSVDFDIDLAHTCKVLDISFDYLVESGTFNAGTQSADSDVVVYIINKTTGEVIQPTTFKLYSNNQNVPEKFMANFQTGVDKEYRLCFHVATTSADAWALKVDNVSVGPSNYVYGTPISDWQGYTPTLTGFGTATNVTSLWRRVGSNLEVHGKATSGTATSTEARWSLPSSLVPDSSKIAATIDVVGSGS